MNALWISVISVAGTLLGSATTGIITYLYNKKTLTIKLDMDLKVESAKTLLQEVYGPIIKIYEQNFEEQYLFDGEYKGLIDEDFKKIEKIMDDNFYLIPLDLYRLVSDEHIGFEESNINSVRAQYEARDQPLPTELKRVYDRESKIYNRTNELFTECRSIIKIKD